MSAVFIWYIFGLQDVLLIIHLFESIFGNGCVHLNFYLKTERESGKAKRFSPAHIQLNGSLKLEVYLEL